MRSVRMKPGRHRVDVDVGRAQLDRGGAGEAQERRLARGVVGDAESRPLGLVRAHAHDLAVVLAPEDRRDGADAVERAGHVGVQHLAPGVLAQAPERAVAGDAGVVDQEVDAAEPLLGLADERARPPPGRARRTARASTLDAHRRQRGLGQHRLLADVPARHVHEAEGDVAAELAELDGDVPSEPGGAPGDDRDLASPARADRLRLRLLERGAAALRGLVLPRRPVAETEGWQGHGLRRYGAPGARASSRDTLHLPPIRAVNSPYASENWSGRSSPWPAPSPGACSPSIGARPSAPPGSCSPPSAPTSSPTASTAASSPTGCSPSTTAAPRRPSGWRTAATSCRPSAGSSSATTSPPSPAPGPLVGPVLAAQFGYLPGTLWIIVGVVLGGAVQDFVILFALDAPRRQVARPDGARRRSGRSPASSRWSPCSRS